MVLYYVRTFNLQPEAIKVMIRILREPLRLYRFRYTRKLFKNGLQRNLASYLNYLQCKYVEHHGPSFRVGSSLHVVDLDLKS